MIAGHLLHFFYTVLLWTHDICKNANLQKVSQKHFLIKKDTRLSSSVLFYRRKNSYYSFERYNISLRQRCNIGTDLTKPFLLLHFVTIHITTKISSTHVDSGRMQIAQSGLCGSASQSWI